MDGERQNNEQHTLISSENDERVHSNMLNLEPLERDSTTKFI